MTADTVTRRELGEALEDAIELTLRLDRLADRPLATEVGAAARIAYAVADVLERLEREAWLAEYEALR
jgi:hypothetical protein